MPALISAATASLSLSTGLPATATPITTMLRVTLKSDRNAAGPLMRLASSGATNWQQVGIGADGVALVVANTTNSATGSALAVGTEYTIIHLRNNSVNRVHLNNNATNAEFFLNLAFTPASLQLGSDGTNWVDCEIRDVRVWTAAISTAEMTAEIAASAPVRTSGLWAWWPLDGDGLDDSGNARHLTVTGSVFAGAQALGAAYISGGAQVHAPTVTPGPVAVSLPAITSGAVVNAPAVAAGPVAVQLSHVPGAAQVHAVSVEPGAASVELSAIESGAQVHAALVGTGGAAVLLPAIAGGAVVYSPAVTAGPVAVELPAIDGAAVVYAAVVEAVTALQLPHVAGAAQVHPPAVAVGAVGVALPYMDSAAQVHPPMVHTGDGLPVALGYIPSGALVFAALVSAIAAGRVLGVEADRRGYVVGFEDRGISVESERRTYAVQGV